MTDFSGALDHAAADALADDLRREVEGEVRRDVPLEGFSTYRLGGPAAVLVEVRRDADLVAVSHVVNDHRPPVLLVGRGSNLLVADAGFPGLAVHLGGDFDEVVVHDETVEAGGGVALPQLARRCATAGRTGLEFYVGIPGSVGGAVRMNAGGHGRETAEVLVSATTFDLVGGTSLDRGPDELDFAYRHSAVAATEVVTGARFKVAPDDPDRCSERIAEIVRWRREHQPGGSNAGSVFTNPPGDSAGRLIDTCGLKGHRVGGAEVSEKHANFFQAGQRATADDVYRLVREVQRMVEDRTGVRLEPELTLVGFEEADGG